MTELWDLLVMCVRNDCQTIGKMMMIFVCDFPRQDDVKTKKRIQWVDLMNKVRTDWPDLLEGSSWQKDNFMVTQINSYNCDEQKIILKKTQHINHWWRWATNSTRPHQVPLLWAKSRNLKLQCCQTNKLES